MPGDLRRRWIGIDVTYLAVNLVRRWLRDTFEAELSPYQIIGALITLREPTKPMRKEAASTGLYKWEPFPEQYPRLLILTIEELLDGKQLLFPRHRVETFRKAERQTKSAANQPDLFLKRAEGLL